MFLKEIFNITNYKFSYLFKIERKLFSYALNNAFAISPERYFAKFRQTLLRKFSGKKTSLNPNKKRVKNIFTNIRGNAD